MRSHALSVLKSILLAVVVVSTLVVGAASMHAMSSGSAPMGQTMAHSQAHHVHEHGMPVTEAHCDGMCELGGVVLDVLCVAGLVAMVVVALLPRRVGGAVRAPRLWNAVVRSVQGFAPPSRDLTELSISRT